VSGKFEITVEDFKARFDRGDIEFILDLRKEDEFESWRIEGKQPVEMVNITQLDFVGDEEKYLDRLPKEREIIVVCAHGDAAHYSAEVLQGLGYKALGLTGGMDDWADLYETSQVSSEPLVFQIYRVAKGCISHVLISAGEAIAIDAVRHLEHIEAVLKSHNATLKHVIDTHLQADHISGGRELAARSRCPYHVHPLDAADAAYEFMPLEDGKIFRFGNSVLETIHSPGHTPGSTSFLLDKRFLLAGDTIMKTSVGRPDLGGMVNEWAGLLYRTIHERFSRLPDELIVLPTHAASVLERDAGGGVSFTLGSARAEMELFALKNEKDFTALIKKTLLENPERYQDIRRVNLGLLEADEKERRDLEIGKNLCGMAGQQ